ncbi:unnamed protein product [Caenorhabditis bovis]|nr:unnamed protein product [Caenorhabditis bovis]
MYDLEAKSPFLVEFMKYEERRPSDLREDYPYFLKTISLSINICGDMVAVDITKTPDYLTLSIRYDFGLEHFESTSEEPFEAYAKRICNKILKRCHHDISYLAILVDSSTTVAQTLEWGRLTNCRQLHINSKTIDDLHYYMNKAKAENYLLSMTADEITEEQRDVLAKITYNRSLPLLIFRVKMMPPNSLTTYNSGKMMFVAQNFTIKDIKTMLRKAHNGTLPPKMAKIEIFQKFEADTKVDFYDEVKAGILNVLQKQGIPRRPYLVARYEVFSDNRKLLGYFEMEMIDVHYFFAYETI